MPKQLKQEAKTKTKNEKQKTMLKKMRGSDVTVARVSDVIVDRGRGVNEKWCGEGTGR